MTLREFPIDPRTREPYCPDCGQRFEASITGVVAMGKHRCAEGEPRG